jgi:hypothetical protein
MRVVQLSFTCALSRQPPFVCCGMIVFRHVTAPTLALMSSSQPATPAVTTEQYHSRWNATNVSPTQRSSTPTPTADCARTCTALRSTPSTSTCLASSSRLSPTRSKQTIQPSLAHDDDDNETVIQRRSRTATLRLALASSLSCINLPSRTDQTCSVADLCAVTAASCCTDQTCSVADLCAVTAASCCNVAVEEICIRIVKWLDRSKQLIIVVWYSSRVCT